MDLVERYLEAVQFWLPKAQKRDIIAELSEDLRSQIEEKEAELGRKLDDKEVEAILKHCGPPLVVATLYLPQRYLIGPTLFPLYRFVLGVCLAGVIIPRCLIWLGFLIASPAHRSYLHMENLWSTIIFFTFFTTLVFVLMERSGVKLAALVDFNPRKLPPVRQPNRISRCSTLFEIGGILVFGGWFVDLFWPRGTLNLYDVGVTVAPIWTTFFASIALLTLVTLFVACMNLVRPFWTRSRALARLLCDAAGGFIFCLFLRSQVVQAISISGVDAEKASKLTGLLNSGMAAMLPYAIAVVAAIVAVDLYRAIRVGRPAMPPAIGVQAGA